MGGVYSDLRIHTTTPIAMATKIRNNPTTTGHGEAGARVALAAVEDGEGTARTVKGAHAFARRG
jgi:hypothetical protein